MVSVMSSNGRTTVGGSAAKAPSGSVATAVTSTISKAPAPDFGQPFPAASRASLLASWPAAHARRRR